MKTRQEIKGIALTAFTDNYWIAVGVNFVIALLIAVAASVTGGAAALVLTPSLVIGLNMFSLALYNGKQATFDTAFNEGFDNFGHKLGGYLWMQLFIFLWSLLFVIPGVIKSYSYALTPYILGDRKDVGARDALKLSMRMMDGHKWELFVFQLSFLGWFLLSSLTGGILGVFYVNPYFSNAMAGYYAERKAAFAAETAAKDAFTPVTPAAEAPTML